MDKIIEFLKEKILRRNYKYVSIEVIGAPRFSDMWGSTNKKIEKISPKEKYVSATIEKQGDKYIRVNESMTKNDGDDFFEVNGMKKGNVYLFKDLGFLGNVERKDKVLLVTNNYVIVGDNDNKIGYSHDEIAKMKATGSIIKLENKSLVEQLNEKTELV